MYDEFFNDGTSRVNKSSSPTDNSAPQDTHPSTNIHPTSEPTTQTNVHAEENNDNQAEFTNPFCTPGGGYVPQQTGFNDPAHPDKFTGLRKALKMKQAPRSLAKYTLEILKKHGMEKGQSIGTPMATKPKLDADLSGEPVDQTDYHSKIRSLMYLTSSRPDIVQAVPFQGTLWYLKGSGFELIAFSDADHAARPNWQMSSAEAEYVALSASCAQVMWMRTQLQDYGFNYNKIPLYCDSQSAIAISCNPVQHSRTKHIHTRYHFIKEQVENGIIELYFVRTEYQLADMFTKALPEERFQYLVRRIGMRCLTPAELEGRMPTKIELTLEQSQQGVSNDVLVSIEEHPSDTYVLTMKMEILLEPASNKLLVGDSLNLPDHRIHKDGDGDASFQLESNSLPHAHAQTTKTYYKHQDSRIMKAQELKTKTSAQTLILKITPQKSSFGGDCKATFQDDAKYEHVGQDTRSQGGKDDQDKQGKDLKISDIKTKSKDNDKGSRSKITKHEGTSLQRIQRPRPQDLNDKSNLINLMKECHNELTSGEIVSLKILSRTMEAKAQVNPEPGPSPYTPTIVTTPAVPAIEDSPPVPEQETVKTVMNMTPENRA
ncbi:hypothetical protein Tco_1291703 [Tanacetum coccineum]